MAASGPLHLREVGAEVDSTEGQVPPTDDTAGRTGTGTRQVLVIAGATVVGWIAAVDEKPWWRLVWDAVSTGSRTRTATRWTGGCSCRPWRSAWRWRGGWRVGGGSGARKEE